jgi:hypothetical protein
MKIKSVRYSDSDEITVSYIKHDVKDICRQIEEETEKLILVMDELKKIIESPHQFCNNEIFEVLVKISDIRFFRGTEKDVGKDVYNKLVILSKELEKEPFFYDKYLFNPIISIHEKIEFFLDEFQQSQLEKFKDINTDDYPWGNNFFYILEQTGFTKKIEKAMKPIIKKICNQMKGIIISRDNLMKLIISNIVHSLLDGKIMNNRLVNNIMSPIVRGIINELLDDNDKNLIEKTQSEYKEYEGGHYFNLIENKF